MSGKESKNWPRLRKIKFISAFILGQLLSICIAFTGFFSNYLLEQGINMPFYQNTWTYLFLMLFLIPRYFSSHGKNKFNQHHSKHKFTYIHFTKYIFLAAIDVAANGLAVTAYSYTSVPLVMLIEDLSIPSAMFFSSIFLKKHFVWTHYVGALTALGGIVIVVSIQFHLHGVGGGFIGDIMTAVAGILYGCENAMQEASAKHYDLFEYYGFLGLFGFVLCWCVTLIFELDDIKSTVWSPLAYGYQCGYTLILLVFYLVSPIVALLSSGPLLAMSLLSSDFWSIIFNLILFKQKFPWYNILCFVIVTLGCLLYLVKSDDRSEETLEFSVEVEDELTDELIRCE